MPRFLLLVACLLGASSLGLAAPAPEPSPSASAAAQNSSIQSPDPATATRAWLDSVAPDKRVRSDAYFEGGYWLILWNFLISAAVSIFLLAKKWSARLRDFAERRSASKLLQTVFYAAPYILLTAAIEFPLTVYESFSREHAYGMANQTFGPWLREQFISLAVSLIVGTLLIVVLYACFRHAARTWWVWGAIVSVVFLVIGAVIAPLFIDPLFNKYTPLTDRAITDPILAMARANQIPVQQVLEVDASRQTKRVSANVAGMFGTARIALNDNLLRECTLPEIRYVMAHEMGHYVLNHVSKFVVDFAVLALCAFAAARAIFDWAIRRWGAKWQVRGISDPAGLPLLALIFTAITFVLTPINNTVVRTAEIEADAFGINTAREPEGMAKVALKLSAYRKLDPSPLEEWIFFDHPSGRARIRMAMEWKAAHLPAAGSQ